MKVCIYGAGAVGSHLATRLVAGGADVSVVARGTQLTAIRSSGLRAVTKTQMLEAHPKASAHPAELGRQDVVIVTMKGPALAGITEEIRPLLGTDTVVVFAMNGIPWWYGDGDKGPAAGLRFPSLDPGDALRSAVGVDRTIGAVVHTSCVVSEPGVVSVMDEHHKIILGRPDGRRDDASEALSAILSIGGMVCPVVPNIRSAIWHKLAMNLSSAPLCMLTRKSLGETFCDEVISAAGARMVEEAKAVAAAMGWPLQLDVEARIATCRSLDHRPSILQDMELGRPLESDALFHVPLQFARLCGVATPTLDLMVAMASLASDVT